MTNERVQEFEDIVKECERREKRLQQWLMRLKRDGSGSMSPYGRTLNAPPKIVANELLTPLM